MTEAWYRSAAYNADDVYCLGALGTLTLRALVFWRDLRDFDAVELRGSV
jgi:hypothetical protein